MVTSSVPFLAQFAVIPHGTLPLPPDCAVDPKTSLLHRRGSNVPLIDELMGRHIISAVHTVATFSQEPDDPDLVRALQRDAFATVVTEDHTDPTDPDTVRAALVGAFDTLCTKSDIDPSDPDTIRHSLADALDTLITRSDIDPSDSDLVRQITISSFHTSYTVGKTDQIDPDLVRSDLLASGLGDRH
jgi:hypothetical protein